MDRVLGPRWQFLLASVIVSSLVCLPGCSGRPKNVARKVTGTVTLGGQPLAGARIKFTPLEGGSPSMGATDESGNYSLVWAFSRGRKIEGAQIGEHVVDISTQDKGKPEKVPYKYRDKERFTATVKAGSNSIDFALESGPVEPPPPPKTKGRGRGK
jgi:hypothetical protein